MLGYMAGKPPAADPIISLVGSGLVRCNSHKEIYRLHGHSPTTLWCEIFVGDFSKLTSALWLTKSTVSGHKLTCTLMVCFKKF